MKKIVSVLLVAALLCSVMMMQAFADRVEVPIAVEAAEEGVALIANDEELNKVTLARVEDFMVLNEIEAIMDFCSLRAEGECGATELTFTFVPETEDVSAILIIGFEVEELFTAPVFIEDAQLSVDVPAEVMENLAAETAVMVLGVTENGFPQTGNVAPSKTVEDMFEVEVDGDVTLTMGNVEDSWGIAEVTELSNAAAGEGVMTYFDEATQSAILEQVEANAEDLVVYEISSVSCEDMNAEANVAVTMTFPTEYAASQGAVVVVGIQVDGETVWYVLETEVEDGSVVAVFPVELLQQMEGGSALVVVVSEPNA